MTWYCLHTKPRREARASDHLASELGLVTYFPRISQRRIYRRVSREMVEALFPRYIFCQADATQLRAIRYAQDVLDVVRMGGEPVKVSEDLIAQLRAWTGSSNILRIEHVFHAGDRVKIIDGPMQGLEAVVLENRSETDRVAILLSILGRDAQLTISRTQLARAS